MIKIRSWQVDEKFEDIQFIRTDHMRDIHIFVPISFNSYVNQVF